MKKWYLILLLTAILYLVLSTSIKQKKGGREILRKLNSTMNMLAWFLLLVYGLAFIYWIIKSVF